MGNFILKIALLEMLSTETVFLLGLWITLHIKTLALTIDTIVC